MFTTLISTEALATQRDGSWVVVDCRYDLRRPSWGRSEYLAGHVPGAVYADLYGDLADPAARAGGRHPMPAPRAMAATFGRLGIGPGVQVVSYDQHNGMFASRLWWMLRYMGHNAVSVLDGGWAKWLREGRPVRSGSETARAARFEGRPHEEMRLSVRDVEARLGDPARLLVDARSPERFDGSSEPIDRAAGHIPGAVNHFYERNVTGEGVMLPPEQLRRQFDELLDGRSPEQVALYCGSGVTACQNVLAMERAGLRGMKLYPGSWSEWVSDPSRPVEIGRRTAHSEGATREAAGERQVGQPGPAGSPRV